MRESPNSSVSYIHYDEVSPTESCLDQREFLTIPAGPSKPPLPPSPNGPPKPPGPNVPTFRQTCNRPSSPSLNLVKRQKKRHHSNVDLETCATTRASPRRSSPPSTEYYNHLHREGSQVVHVSTIDSSLSSSSYSASPPNSTETDTSACDSLRLHTRVPMRREKAATNKDIFTNKMRRSGTCVGSEQTVIADVHTDRNNLHNFRQRQLRSADSFDDNKLPFNSSSRSFGSYLNNEFHPTNSQRFSSCTSLHHTVDLERIYDAIGEDPTRDGHSTSTATAISSAPLRPKSSNNETAYVRELWPSVFCLLLAIGITVLLFLAVTNLGVLHVKFISLHRNGR